MDALLWSALELRVLSRLPPGFTFLNIGGGDGRWAQSIATRRPDSTGVRYGVSAGVAESAQERAAGHGYAAGCGICAATWQTRRTGSTAGPSTWSSPPASCWALSPIPSR
ncbi:hypothetical protein GXW82_02050 [Streptacidiphilus sp. 4-A2]|nr:hypothetical protein [Streptacidiphilus sp. 4-A2]